MEAVNHGIDMTLADGLFLEATLFGVCCATEDKNEGTKAFLEKRQRSLKASSQWPVASGQLIVSRGLVTSGAPLIRGFRMSGFNTSSTLEQKTLERGNR